MAAWPQLLLTARQGTGTSVSHPHNTITACEVNNNSCPLTNKEYFSRFHFVQGGYRCLRTAPCLVIHGSRSLTFVICSLRVSMHSEQFCYSPGVKFGGRWKWTWRVTWRIWSSVDFWRWSCRENRESLHTRQVTIIKDFILSLIASDKLFLS